jgi:hypothetical protein
MLEIWPPFKRAKMSENPFKKATSTRLLHFNTYLVEMIFFCGSTGKGKYFKSEELFSLPAKIHKNTNILVNGKCSSSTKSESKLVLITNQNDQQQEKLYLSRV